MLPVPMATLWPEHVQDFEMESGSLELSIKQLRKFKFIHLHLHHKIVNARECIIFVRCLN